MSLTKLANYISYLVVVTFLYICICMLFFILPFISNIFGIGIPNHHLLLKQQKIYNEAPMRSIWQGDAKCATPNKSLGYVPRLGMCAFENFEFSTKNTYTETGWLDFDFDVNKKTIIVVGDSHAMGWGVNTSDSFSKLLSQNSFNVINLATSSWGTEQGARAAIESQYFPIADYIIFQYCDNDAHKNVNKENYISTEYEYYVSHSKGDFTPLSFKERVSNGANFLINNFSIYDYFSSPFSSIESMFSNPEYGVLDVYTPIQTQSHLDLFMNVVNGYPELLNKKILVFYSNGWGKQFIEFEKRIDNVDFIDLGLERKHYYWIDDHLNVSGHRYISESLMKFISEK